MDFRQKALKVLQKDAGYEIPPFISQELSQHFTKYPNETEFIIELAPGTGYGVVTCLDECWTDFHLGPNTNAPSGGAVEGLGSLQAFQVHATTDKEHAINRNNRLKLPPPGAVQAPAAPVNANNRYGEAIMVSDDDEVDVKPAVRKPDIDLSVPQKRFNSDGAAFGGIDKKIKVDSPEEIARRRAEDLRRATAEQAARVQAYAANLAAQNVMYAEQQAVKARQQIVIDQQKAVILARKAATGDDDKPPGFDDEDAQEGAYNDQVAMGGDLDEFIKHAADGHDFEGNATVEQARAKLKLATLSDKIPGMRIKLMPHQFISVAWMAEQEKSKNFGGILADEMGLGKTVSAIGIMTFQPSKDKAERTNLIVAPLSLLQQWKDEIESKCVPNFFKVLIHHGSTKAKSKEELQSYDVVLTTYQTLSGEWADEEGSLKKANAKRRKQGLEESDDYELKEHGPLFNASFYRVILDEAQFIRNRATRASRAVARIDCLLRWCLTGTPITNSLSDLYGLLRFIHIKPWYDWTEYSKHIMSLEKKRPHIAGKKAQAILKVCLLRRKKDTKLDGQPLITLPEKHVVIQELEFSPEEREIYSFVQSRSQATFNKYLKRGEVLKNYAQVLVMLLRLRQIACHPALISEGYDALATGDIDEDSLAKELEKAVDLLGDGFVAKIKAERLAKAVERFTLERSDANAIMPEDECGICFEILGSGEGGAIVTACGHTYCRACIIPVLSQDQADQDGEEVVKLKPDERPCPHCRQAISANRIFTLGAFEPSDEEVSAVTGIKITPIEEDEEDDDMPVPAAMKRKRKNGVVEDSEDEEEKKETKDSDDEDEPMSEKKAGKRKAKPKKEKKEKAMDSWMIKVEPSAKMRWLLAEIQRVGEANPDDKFLVLCSFTKMLDIVDDYLTGNGIKTTRYQGDMSRVDRDRSIRVLQKSTKVKVILMSLKCGGVGLNLVRANHVINLDLAWSPAVEDQAFSRSHRIGQEKPVFVHRLTIKDSIDQRIAEMQERKRGLAEASLGEGKAEKVGKMSVGDLAALFGLKPNGKPLDPVDED